MPAGGMASSRPSEEYCSLFPEAANFIKAEFQSSGIGSRTAVAPSSSEVSETGTTGQWKPSPENTVSYSPTDAQNPGNRDARWAGNGAGKQRPEDPSTVIVHERHSDRDAGALPDVPGLA